MSKSPKAIVKTSSPAGIPDDYPGLLQGIKQRIRAAQVQATLSANAQLLYLYWDIGRAIAARQGRADWGTAVIPRLALDLRNDLPEIPKFRSSLPTIEQIETELSASTRKPPRKKPG